LFFWLFFGIVSGGGGGRFDLVGWFLVFAVCFLTFGVGMCVLARRFCLEWIVTWGSVDSVLIR